MVGVLAGFAALGLFVFLWRRRASARNDAYTGSSKSPLGFSDPFRDQRMMAEHKASLSGGSSSSIGQSQGGHGATPVVPPLNFGGLGGLQPPLENHFMAVDQRLNPVMLGERRLSEGSIADERDYSRKILRVANPDA